MLHGAEALDFRDVQAFSADEAYLLAAGPGDQSRIFKTVEAGNTWTLQFTNAEPKGLLRLHGVLGPDARHRAGRPR